MKKLLLLLLAVFTVSYSSFAQFTGGTGTEANPYQITTATQMNNVRYYLDKFFILMNDINLTDYTYTSGQNPYGWVPLGTLSAPFTGNFNGNGYAISGLYTREGDFPPDPAYHGSLFGRTYNAIIENLTVHSENVSGKMSGTGILIGHGQNGVVYNCHVAGNVTGTSAGSAGLLVGYADKMNISFCTATGTVYGYDVGALVGSAPSSTITACHTEASVGGNRYAGGLLASAYNTVINDCYSSCTVSKINGGFVGFKMGNGNAFNNCYYNSSQHTGTAIGATGKTTAQMMQQATYINWDFINTWIIQEGISYPILRGSPEGISLITSISLPIAYEYDYDACGNRILRRVITLESKGGSKKSTLVNTPEAASDTSGYGQPYIDMSSKMQVKVYPNPTQGKLKVAIQTQEDLTFSLLELYNTSGNKIYSQQNLNSNVEIDITNQPAGIYIMRVKANNHSSEWKIIKQ